MYRSPAVENGGRNGIHHRRRAPKQYKYAHNTLINKLVTRLYFILTITWSLAYVVCKHRIDDRKSWTCFAGHFDGHDDAPVRCRAYRPMQHVQGYLKSHWTPPSGDYLSRIAPADAMVIKFLPNKSSCGVVKSLSEASVKKARNGPSTQPTEATSCVERANATIKAATIKAEELSKLSSYHTLTTDKNR